MCSEFSENYEALDMYISKIRELKSKIDEIVLRKKENYRDPYNKILTKYKTKSLEEIIYSKDCKYGNIYLDNYTSNLKKGCLLYNIEYVKYDCKYVNVHHIENLNKPDIIDEPKVLYIQTYKLKKRINIKDYKGSIPIELLEKVDIKYIPYPLFFESCMIEFKDGEVTNYYDTNYDPIFSKYNYFVPRPITLENLTSYLEDIEPRLNDDQITYLSYYAHDNTIDYYAIIRPSLYLDTTIITVNGIKFNLLNLLFMESDTIYYDENNVDNDSIFDYIYNWETIPYKIYSYFMGDRYNKHKKQILTKDYDYMVLFPLHYFTYMEHKYEYNREISKLFNYSVNSFFGETSTLKAAYIMLKYIENQYIYINLFKTLFSDLKGLDKSDRQSFKGLGKRILCSAIKYIQNDMDLDDTFPVKLTASFLGKPKYVEDMEKTIEKYEQMDVEELTKILEKTMVEIFGEERMKYFKKEIYPDDFYTYYDKYSTYELAEKIYRYKQFPRLLSYYGRYGFEITGYNSVIGVNMKSTIGKIKEFCNK